MTTADEITLGAKALNSRHIVAHEQDGSAFPRRIPHLAEALLLERGVPYREDLVDNEDLRLEVSGNGEGQTHIHAARVPLHRCVHELLYPGEVHDLLQLPVDLGSFHAQDIA